MNYELEAFNAGYTRGHKTGYESGKKAGAEQARREAKIGAFAVAMCSTPDLRNLIGRRVPLPSVVPRTAPKAAPASTPTCQFEVGVFMSAKASSDEPKSGVRRGEVEVRIMEKTLQGVFLRTGRAFCDIEDKWSSTTGLKLAFARAATALNEHQKGTVRSFAIARLVRMVVVEFNKITTGGADPGLLRAELMRAYLNHKEPSRS